MPSTVTVAALLFAAMMMTTKMMSPTASRFVVAAAGRTAASARNPPRCRRPASFVAAVSGGGNPPGSRKTLLYPLSSTDRCDPRVAMVARSFRASSALLMGKRRKRNGGRPNRKSGKTMSEIDEAQKGEEEESEEEESNEKESVKVSSSSSEGATQPPPPSHVFVNEFATEYHAPVMAAECADAVLGRGVWGKIWQRRLNDEQRRKSGIKGRRRDTDDDDESFGADDDGDGSDGGKKRRGRLFVDGTLGGGGHSLSLLQQLGPDDVLVGCDVDPDALRTASERLKDYLATPNQDFGTGDDCCRWEEGRPLFVPVQCNFADLARALSDARHPRTGRPLVTFRGDDGDGDGDVHGEAEFPNGADGMLLDLGVSSHQIDTPERGFAFMKDGPLDMRMSGNANANTGDGDGKRAEGGRGLSAADICNEFDEDALASALREYGDEPRSRRIAAAIIESRPLRTTTDLKNAINAVTPTFARQRRAGLTATSARVFQALRIVVNEEDRVLREALEQAAPAILRRNGGRLAVLSYHSMEDRMAKRVMRDGSTTADSRAARAERDIYGNVVEDESLPPKPFQPLGKPRKATEEEVEVNGRARSATLRVAVRV